MRAMVVRDMRFAIGGISNAKTGASAPVGFSPNGADAPK
jgi:hypothetical protein